MHPRSRRLAAFAALLLGLVPALASAQVVISQIYTPGGGGGGSSGYASSYIELHNNGTSAVSLAGWSVQYTMTSAWMVTPISGSIPAGGFYLVKEGNNNPSAPPLPGFDASGSIFMVPASGRVALVSSTLQANGCGNGVPLVDLVGYGGGGCNEGGVSAPAMGPTTADLRKTNGCQDTNINGDDFTNDTPNPRWSGTTAIPCVSGTPLLGSATATPNVIIAGNSVLFTVAVTPATAPASTGITVTGNLSALGGLSLQTLYDDGTNGDVTAGDNVFSLGYATAFDQAPASYSVPFTINDAESRFAVANAPFQIVEPVVISQIYSPGGGGGSFNHSYIELHNRGPHPATLTGWTVQYSGFTDTTWVTTSLNGSINPGGYYLIQETNDNPGNPPLPPADATGDIWIYPAGGKVALMPSPAPIDHCPAKSAYIDFVGYGQTQCWEGQSGPAPNAGPMAACLRKQVGCQDTNDNAADFENGPAKPRNTAWPAASCVGTPPTGVAAATPSIIPTGGTTLFTVATTPGGGPPSSGITVAGDLSGIGGAASQPLYDDGTHGDAIAGDAVFSLSYAVPVPAAGPGLYSIPFTIADAEGRSSTANASLQIVSPVVVSQIFTPGGSGGSPKGYSHSYIELHNRGNAPASLAGWSVQYAQSGGGSWFVTPLSGTIPVGGYYLIQEDNPAPQGQPMPTPDAVGTTWLYPAVGQVAVVASGAPLSSCGVGAPIIDLIGYGGAQCREGSNAQGIGPMNALFRKDQGCQDTNNNLADCMIGTPLPRNSASPIVNCALPAPPPASAGTSQTAVGPGFPVLLTNYVPPAGPASMAGGARVASASATEGAYSVTADLVAFDGGIVPMHDDGTNGDQIANDYVYSYLLTIPQGTPSGDQQVPMTTCDASNRCGTVSAVVHVASPTGVGEVPLAFALHAPEPNPAIAGAFALRFSLPSGEPARVALLDVAGRRVASMDVVGAGNHVVRFGETTRLAPGVYLARLTQGSRTATTRVIVR